MKLIHCADFHLDAPMSANFPPAKAVQRRNELLRCFAHMADYAEKNEVSAILIAGDLFDRRNVSRKTRDFVRDTIAAHPSIGFYYLHGNHDEAAAEPTAPLPENLHRFGAEWTSYPLGEVTVSGIEPHGDAAWWENCALPQHQINVVLLHGQAGSACGDGQIPLCRLRGRGIDYLALGHIHTFHQETLDERGSWAYAGCPEGRGFDECGEKGFVLLETAHSRLTTRFVPFALRTLHECAADLTGAATAQEQRDRIAQAVQTIPEADMVRLTLTGACMPDNLPDVPLFAQMLDEHFFLARVQDATRLQLDAAALRAEPSLRGAFFRLVEQEPLSEADRADILRAGFSALDGEPIF